MTYSLSSASVGRLLTFLSAFLLCPILQGADSYRYASNSKLSSGDWVKISVSVTGIQFLSNEDLNQMGFSSVDEIKVFGYGGSKIPDIIDPGKFIDDLPQVLCIRDSKGIFFYAEGPYTIESDEWNHNIVVKNPFSNYSYYFLTDNPDIAPLNYESETISLKEPPLSFSTCFMETLQHEIDMVSPGETGHYLVGEDLKYTPSRRYVFDIANASGDEAYIGASVFTNLISGAAWTIEANFTGDSGQKKITKTIAAPSATASNSFHGNVSSGWSEPFDLNGDGKLTVTLTLGGNSSNVRSANVDRVTVNYSREIELSVDNPAIYFTTASNTVRIKGGERNTVLLDVSDAVTPRQIKEKWIDSEGHMFFRNNIEGRRTYAAFNPLASANFQRPVFVEKVANQNLHGMENIDMVIFSPSQFMNAARSLAEYRSRASEMNVETICQDWVFNEFSSGRRDVNAFRKFLKMLRDRARESQGNPPRFVLLFGRSTYDNRRLTAGSANLGYDPLPQWQTDEGLNDNTSFPSDDILGMLDDFSGLSLGNDTLSIAIGRLPVTSLTQAHLLVEKIISYETSSPAGAWRNRALFIADDEDAGVHMSQTENMINLIEDASFGSNMLKDKIYLDAYELTGGVTVGAREELFRSLDEGILWLNYIGHANSTTLSSEGIFNYADIGSLFLKKIPFIYAATCDFMRWDTTSISGAERLALTKGGGVIGAFSATRPVYITQNGTLTEAVGRHLSEREPDGLPLPLGEIFRRAKNDVKDQNKLRFSLLGDPSMRLLYPLHEIVIDSVDNVEFPGADDNPPVLKARQDLKISGTVKHSITGKTMEEFNGVLSSTLYDAEESITTLGHGTNGVKYTFENHGARLFVGNDSVRNGRFIINIAMPAEVADNFRPATLSMFATSSTEAELNAAAVEKRLYVYGTDESAQPDTIPPVIESIFLNHPSFKNGSIVNPDPMLIAELSDNHSINMSLAGIGHWMSLSLDNGAITYNDISNYYEPTSIDRGTLYYPLSDIENGPHDLTLRIWDSAGNSCSQTINFFVDETVQPTVFDIYTDSNPASSTANFYLLHDRPDGDLRVTVTIYDLLGRPIWVNTVSGQADLFRSFPVNWDLTDMSGRRVPRGIYLYRATVSDLSGKNGTPETVTPTRKIAVTSR